MDKYITSQHYSELLSQIEKLREENDILKANYRKESERTDKETERADRERKRADELQIKVDTFDAIEEMEVAIHLSRGRYEN